MGLRSQDGRRSPNKETFDNDSYLKAVKNDNPDFGQGQQNHRDVVSEIDYSDRKSAIYKIGQVKRRAPSQAPSQLTNDNLRKFENGLTKSAINKGGGASVYSDARSQYSKYRKHLKELSTCSKSQSLQRKNITTLSPTKDEQDGNKQDQNPKVDNNLPDKCSFWGNKLKESEIEFHRTIMEMELNQKDQAEKKDNKEVPKNIENILWAKWVYNSVYLKSFKPDIQSPEVKPKIAPEAAPKQNVDLDTTLNPKVENDRLLNWRSERDHLNKTFTKNTNYVRIINISI